MSLSRAKTFTALLEGDGTSLRWVIARVPFDVAKAWPERKRLRVRGAINGFALRTSLFPIPGGGGHMLLVNKKMQAGAKAYRGDQAKITLEPDLEERNAIMPSELARSLKGDRRLRKWFDGLGEYTRRMLCAMVGESKSPEARAKQAERIAERLLLAMEGELETPPILKAAFARAAARRGRLESDDRGPAARPPAGHLLLRKRRGPGAPRRQGRGRRVESRRQARRGPQMSCFHGDFAPAHVFCSSWWALLSSNEKE